MTERAQLKVRLDPELDAVSRRYAAAHNVTHTALVQAALKQYLSHTSPYEATMKRLDRLSAQLEQQRRMLHLLAEAVGAYVHLWLGHTPEVHPQHYDAARGSAQARYQKWTDHVARRLSAADSFFLRFSKTATPAEIDAALDAARMGREGEHA